jgi:glycosyltransferase involved in cell wall biosynthesis
VGAQAVGKDAGVTVSVVIPTYNCAPRLLRALRSVAAQTYRDVEIVVIDDGSTDNTAESVAAWTARSGANVRYVRQTNAGPAAARNHGMRLASGDAIAFLDADDEWRADKLEKQMPLLKGNVGLVYCSNSFVDSDGKPLTNYVRRVELHRGDILLPLFCDLFLLTSAVVISKAAYEAVGEFDEQLAVGEDYEFFLRLARKFHADYSPEELLIRCVRPDSLSRLDYAKDARNDIATLSKFLRDNPDFAQRHRAAIADRLARYRYDFGYRLLAENRRDEALRELWSSWRTRPTLAASKTLMRALISGRRT